MADEDDPLAPLLARQRVVSSLTDQLLGESDPNRILALSALILDEGRALEAEARAIEAKYASQPALGTTEVVLTPAQR